MFKSYFFHQSREPLDEVLRKHLYYFEGYEIILLLVLHRHQIQLLARLLHQREKCLKLDIMRLAYLQHLVQCLNCLTSYEWNITWLEVLDVSILVNETAEPGNELRLLGLIATHRVP